MSDLRRPSLRIGLGLTVVVLGLLEVQSLVQGLRLQSRLHERMIRAVREAFLTLRPVVERELRGGDHAGQERALLQLLGSPLFAEAELYDGSGARLAARPLMPPPPRPLPEDLAALRRGDVLVFGPLGVQPPHLLVYAGAISGGREVYFRVGAPVPDLVVDMRERSELLIAHGVGLVLLAVAAALVIFPGRSEPALPTSPAILAAYAEALERLRHHEQALSAQHRAERHRLEEEVEDKQALARAGELTAGIVHEMRNGLGTILGYARLIEGQGDATAAAEAALQIRQECGTLGVVIRRFMDYVRSESLKLESFDLRRMLARVVARESRGTGAPVVLADPGAPAPIVADEELLERVFENLLRNAREAAGEHGQVWVNATVEAGDVIASVADDGPGMSAAAQAGLRPFYSTRAGGLGLGLAIAFKIVRLHQGQLVLDSRLPHGLVVSVRLPAAGPVSDLTPHAVDPVPGA